MVVGIAGHLQCRISTKSLCWAVMKLNHVNVDLGGFLVPGMEFPMTFPRWWFEAKKQQMFTPHFEEVEPNLTCAYSSKMCDCNRRLYSFNF